jgi:hypothetical protein
MAKERVMRRSPCTLRRRRFHFSKINCTRAASIEKLSRSFVVPQRFDRRCGSRQMDSNAAEFDQARSALANSRYQRRGLPSRALEVASSLLLPTVARMVRTLVELLRGFNACALREDKGGSERHADREEAPAFSL